jgi:hypothetical protein
MLLSQVINLNEMLEAAVVAEDENVLEGLTKVSQLKALDLPSPPLPCQTGPMTVIL